MTDKTNNSDYINNWAKDLQQHWFNKDKEEIKQMLYFDNKEEPKELKEETYIKFDKETYIKDGALPFRPLVKLQSNLFRSDDREITPLQKELTPLQKELEQKEPLQGLEITSIDEVLQNKIRYMMSVKRMSERQIFISALERYHTEVKNSIERLERVKQLISLVKAKEEETTEVTPTTTTEVTKLE